MYDEKSAIDKGVSPLRSKAVGVWISWGPKAHFVKMLRKTQDLRLLGGRAVGLPEWAPRLDPKVGRWDPVSVKLSLVQARNG